MRIKSKALSVAWKLLLVAFATFGLLDGSGILAGHYESGFPHMFTNISNLFAWGYFLVAAIWMARRNSSTETAAPACNVKYTATISLLVTMLIAHFLLFDAMFQNGQLVVHLVILHYIVPIMALLDWLLFDEKGKMVIWGPLAWMSLVLAYLAFTMVGVGVFGMYLGGGTTADISPYPYTFLDPTISGVGGVAIFCVIMIAAFLALGFVLYGIDRLMGGRTNKSV